MILLHPREATLLRYAAGSAQETARRRVASHLADCDKCRGTVQSTREIRVALASGAAVGAPDLLLQKILQSRMNGERVILPVEAPAPTVRFASSSQHRGELRFPRPVFMVMLGSAAAVALFSVGIDRWSTQVIDRANGIPADQRPQPLEIDRTIPPAGPFAPARLRPVALRYGEVMYRGATAVDSRETVGIRLVRANPPGQEWMAITEDRRRDGRPDTIWINAETLEPSRWGWKGFSKGFGYTTSYGVRNDRIEEQYRVQLPPGVELGSARADSFARAWGLTSLLSRDTSFALPPDHPTFALGQAHLVAAMMAAPLAVGWRGAFAHPGITRSKTLRYFNERTVTITGTQRVVTPAGVFDCWEGVVRQDGFDRLQWYRKSDGLFVGESMGEGSTTRVRTLLLSEE